jgi:hypothetical protein
MGAECGVSALSRCDACGGDEARCTWGRTVDVASRGRRLCYQVPIRWAEMAETPLTMVGAKESIHCRREREGGSCVIVPSGFLSVLSEVCSTVNPQT